MERFRLKKITAKQLDQLIELEERHGGRKFWDMLNLSALYELRARREAEEEKITITPAGLKQLQIMMDDPLYEADKELRSCPKCGAAHAGEIYKSPCGYFVICVICKYKTEICITDKTAIKTWNRQRRFKK